MSVIGNIIDKFLGYFRKEADSFRLRFHPDPVLTRVSEPVDPALLGMCYETGGVSSLVEGMRGVLAEHPTGVGLSAPQVGVNLRVILVEQLPMINPVILRQKGRRLGVEACLSIPGFQKRVRRPTKVRVGWLAPSGISMESWFRGLGAQIICHEIDHLDGILINDEEAGL